MAHISSDVCEMQLKGVSEVMDLLQIDVWTDEVEDRPGREDAACSVSCFTDASFEIRTALKPLWAAMGLHGSSLPINLFILFLFISIYKCWPKFEIYTTV